MTKAVVQTVLANLRRKVGPIHPRNPLTVLVFLGIYAVLFALFIDASLAGAPSSFVVCGGEDAVFDVSCTEYQVILNWVDAVSLLYMFIALWIAFLGCWWISHHAFFLAFLILRATLVWLWVIFEQERPDIILSVVGIFGFEYHIDANIAFIIAAVVWVFLVQLFSQEDEDG